jgi:uncharacterized protein
LTDSIFVVSNFVGRSEDLARLQEHLSVVRATGRGRLVVVHGRRQVGKSRLVSEFLGAADAPSLFFSGGRQHDTARDLELFIAESQRSSTLANTDLIDALRPTTWDAALRLIANSVHDQPSIVVLDEFPWLLESDPGLDGTLQAVWDRELEKRPVLFILIGSDPAVMESLSTHGRPLYGRARELVVRPFSPRDTGRMLGHDDDRVEHGTTVDAEIFDSYLVTGGYPRLTAEAARFKTLEGFINNQLTNEHSDLCVMAQQSLRAEFPSDSAASTVLHAVGSGERSFRNIAAASRLGDMAVHRSLDVLEAKRVIARDQPASVPSSNQPRYRIDDPYLRCWLGLVAPLLGDIARGRSDLAKSRFAASWQSWRGRAIEPVIRTALSRLAINDPRLMGAAHVSGWWPRSNKPEVDLVGVDRIDHPTRVAFAGSIKWREREPFGASDFATLQRDAAVVPGVDANTARIVVSRSGSNVNDIDVLTPTDLLQAWS